jgi:hypothetical protein
MALTFTELESITNDYFKADNKKAVDIYFNTSFWLDYFMNKKKGLWERPNGGRNIRIPLEYDGQEGGFFTRSSALSSTDRVNINAAFFGWKHAYGNATVYLTDELENAGEYAEVQMVTQRIASAQKTCSKLLAENVYGSAVDASSIITGLRALCNETTTTAYGNIQEADLVAADGTTPWEGKLTATTEAISLAVIRTLATYAKIGDGPNGKPDVGTTTEALFNIISGILQVQQRFTADTDTAKAGFTNLVFEQKILAADDFCPAGFLFLCNSKFIGFAIHTNGYFVRTPWGDLLVTGVAARSMKIFWHGNMICSNRKAHAGHSNLS